MRASLLLLGVFGCGGGGARPAPVDNTGGGDKPRAPCFPDREHITARELYEAASAGPPGACTLADSPAGDPEFPVREIHDVEVLVGRVDPCGVDVLVPRITDERGIAVGDGFDALVAAYPAAEQAYRVSRGLHGEPRLQITMGFLSIASFELDGTGPPTPLDGDAAIALLDGRRVASYRAVFMCD